MSQLGHSSATDDAGDKRVAFRERMKNEDLEGSMLELKIDVASPGAASQQARPLSGMSQLSQRQSFRQSSKSMETMLDAQRALVESMDTPELESGASSNNETWVKMVFGIGPKTKRSAGSVLIHPSSPFYVTSSFLIAMFLLYTAIVTPVMVSFYWEQEACTRMPTLEFDILVDCIFLVDIIVTFFVGVYHEGKYCDDHCFVVLHYLRHGFFFDLFTSFPVSFMEAAILAECDSAGETGIEISPSSLRMIRVVKPLRLFKLIRIIKVIKTLAIADAIADRFRIPPRILRLIKVLSGIALGVHTCASIFWLCKVLSRTPEQIEEFKETYEISDAVEDQYAACFYFITTIITTIGFGDFVPENTTERIFAIIVMYIGSMIFGILLAEVQQVVAQASQDAREKDAVIQTLLDFMRENEIPRETENEVIRWAQFDFNQKQSSRKQTEVLAMLPHPLRRKLVHFLHKDALEQIPMFSDMSHPSSKDLMLDLYAAMTTVTFYPKSLVCESSQSADRLFLMASGVAKMEIAPRCKDESKPAHRLRVAQSGDGDSDSSDADVHTGKELILLTLGDYFGENCLLGETDYGATFPGFSVTITAVTNVMCLVLTTESFQEVISSYPSSLQEDVRTMAQEYHAAKKTQKILEKSKHAHIVYKWGKISKKLKRKAAPVGLFDHFGKRLARHIETGNINVFEQNESGGSGIISSEEDCASSPQHSRHNGEKVARRHATVSATNHDNFPRHSEAPRHHHQLNLKLEDLSAQMHALTQIVAGALPPQNSSWNVPTRIDRTRDAEHSERRHLLPVSELPNGGMSRVSQMAGAQDVRRTETSDEPEPEIVYLSAA